MPIYERSFLLESLPRPPQQGRTRTGGLRSKVAAPTAELFAISLRVGNNHQNCISIPSDLKVKAVILIYPRLPDITSLIVFFRFKGGVTKVRQKKAKLFVELGFEGCRERGVLIDRFLSKLNFSLGHEKPTSLHGGEPEQPP